MKAIPKKRVRENTLIATLDAREIAVLHALLSYTDPEALHAAYDRMPEQYRSKITGLDFGLDIGVLQGQLHKLSDKYKLFT